MVKKETSHYQQRELGHRMQSFYIEMQDYNCYRITPWFNQSRGQNGNSDK